LPAGIDARRAPQLVFGPAEHGQRLRVGGHHPAAGIVHHDPGGQVGEQLVETALGIVRDGVGAIRARLIRMHIDFWLPIYCMLTVRGQQWRARAQGRAQMLVKAR
jgi:hypothetical protein